MSVEGQGHFFTIYFPGFVFFCALLAKISGERLQDHWSSGLGSTVSVCSTFLLDITALLEIFSPLFQSSPVTIGSERQGLSTRYISSAENILSPRLGRLCSTFLLQ